VRDRRNRSKGDGGYWRRFDGGRKVRRKEKHLSCWNAPGLHGGGRGTWTEAAPRTTACCVTAIVVAGVSNEVQTNVRKPAKEGGWSEGVAGASD